MKKYLLIFFGCVAFILAAIGFTACDNKGGSDFGITHLLGDWKWLNSYGDCQEIWHFDSDGTGYYVHYHGTYYSESDKVYFAYTYNERKEELTIITIGGYYSGERMTYGIEWFGDNKVYLTYVDDYYYDYGYYDEGGQLFIKL